MGTIENALSMHLLDNDKGIADNSLSSHLLGTSDSHPTPFAPQGARKGKEGQGHNDLPMGLLDESKAI